MAAINADTLDMSLFFGTETQKKEFCESLLALLKKRGCVKLQNHGIPAEDIKQLFEQVRHSTKYLCSLSNSRRPKSSSTFPTRQR